MLPRALNSNICSLLPNQPRFAISLYFVISEDGLIDLSSVNYEQTLIRNAHKLSYERADKLIMGEADSDQAKLQEKLRWLHKVTGKRREFRSKYDKVEY